jgi:hypothetical protein
VLPLSLRITNRFHGMAQIGFFLLAFSTPFFWLFAGNADISFLTFRGDLATAPATVKEVVDTRASESRRRVYANHYSFFADGHEFSGVSYSSGEALQPSAVVTVHYDPKNPLHSRLEGMRPAMFGPGALFVLIFPAIGLALTWFAVKSGGTTNRLLQNGITARGKLCDKRPTNMRVNNRPVWELVFEYTGQDGMTHQASTKTSLTAKLTDDAEEELLYDPENPQEAVFLDSLGSRPQLDETGAYRGSLRSAILVLILPTLVIVGNLYMGWSRFAH